MNPGDALLREFESNEKPEARPPSSEVLRAEAEHRRQLRFSGFFDPEHYRMGAATQLDGRTDLLRHFFEQGAIEGLSVCDPAKLCERLREIDGTDLSRPELAYLSESVASGEPVSDARVVVYVSREGNSFFREMAELLVFGFARAGAEARIADETESLDESATHRIVVAPHEFFLLGDGRKRLSRRFLSRCFLYLAEQPGSKYFSMCLWYGRHALGILDLNPLSAMVFSLMGYRARSLPLGFIEGFEPYEGPISLADSTLGQALPEAARNWSSAPDAPLAERPIDVFFNGVISARRGEFFARNAALFSSLRCAIYMPTPSQPLAPGVASALATREATALSQRSKIQLNIHRDQLPYFEWHRNVVRGIWQRALVVTETSFPIPWLEAGRHYVECDFEEIPERVAWLLRTREGQAEAEAIRTRGYQALRSKFSLERMAERFLADPFAKGGASGMPS